MNRIRTALIRLVAFACGRPDTLAELEAEMKTLKDATDGELVAMAEQIVNHDLAGLAHRAAMAKDQPSRL